MINDELTNVLRSLAAQTVSGMNLSDFVFGRVVSENPLQIRLDAKRTIGEEFFVLSDNVRDYAVDIEVLHTTENRAGGGGEATYASHNHDYSGRKKIIVYNGLKIGEQVVLLKQSGGQMYYVVNRVYMHSDVHGQWG